MIRHPVDVTNTNSVQYCHDDDVTDAIVDDSRGGVTDGCKTRHSVDVIFF